MSESFNNPSLRQEPRSQRAPVIPLQNESSILDWLESSGRLLARDSSDFSYSDEEDPDINELMTDENGFGDLDDDDDDMLDLEE